jgi:ubiquinone/menaquinone biosynthesis C-methylase UbiE
MPKITGGNALLDVNIILTKAGVSDKMRFADLGCGGTGHFVFPAAILVGKKGSVYAVDIMKPALEAIRRRKKQENLSNIEIVWSNLEIFNATNIEANSIDVALLANTLYQSHKRIKILQEAVRMIKRNGKLVIVEWKSITAPFGPPVEERVNKDAITESSKNLGLKFEAEFFAGQYHYGLIFVKL